jgi:hypothetical protein
MHHLKVRSEAGLLIQEHFAAFAANFVHWAAYWLAEQCPHLDEPFDTQPLNVKGLVQVGANTSAWVIWQQGVVNPTIQNPALSNAGLLILISLSRQPGYPPLLRGGSVALRPHLSMGLPFRSGYQFWLFLYPMS